MHLAIDVREACNPRKTGKGGWTKDVVSELLLRDVTLHLFTDAPIPSEWHEHRARVVVHRFAPGLSWHLRCAWKLFTMRTTCAYLSPTSFIVPALLGKRVRIAAVVHDLIAFRPDVHDRKASFIEKRTLPRVLRTAALIFTVSEATKADLLHRFPHLDAARVIPAFAGPLPGMRDLHADPSSDPRIILCMGTLCPRKNQLGLIRGYALLPPAVRRSTSLILTGGRGWHDDEIIALTQTTPGVEWKGYVTDEEYRALLSRATVFALPSFYEGFGLPVLDAMTAGVPVLTSDRGSLAEVAGDACVAVVPEDPQSIEEGLRRLLTDDDLRARLIAKGKERAAAYSWRHTADILASALSSRGMID